MEFIKKQSVGVWITLGALLLSLIAIIIYGANVAGVGYFNDMPVTPVVVFGVLALIALAAVIVLNQFRFEGIVGKVISILVDALKIIAPMFLSICLISFISSRVEGLAYLFFSNEEILATIQIPENLASANSAITGFIFFGIATVVASVGAFFSKKKDRI